MTFLVNEGMDEIYHDEHLRDHYKTKDYERERFGALRQGLNSDAKREYFDTEVKKL